MIGIEQRSINLVEKTTPRKDQTRYVSRYVLYPKKFYLWHAKEGRTRREGGRRRRSILTEQRFGNSNQADFFRHSIEEETRQFDY